MKRVMVVSLALVMVLSAVAFADGMGSFSAFKNGITYLGTGPPMLELCLSEDNAMLELAESFMQVESAITVSLATNAWNVSVETTAHDAYIYVIATNAWNVTIEANANVNDAYVYEITIYSTASDGNLVLVDFMGMLEDIDLSEVLNLTPTILTRMSSASAPVNVLISSPSALNVAELRSILISTLVDDRVIGKFFTAGVTTFTMFANMPEHGQPFLWVFTDIARGLTSQELIFSLHSYVVKLVPLGQTINFSGALSARNNLGRFIIGY